MLPLVSTMPAFSALTIGGIKCGTKICELYQFCSDFHSDCDDCAPVCDENNHNFDKEVCVAHCRGEILLICFITHSCFFVYVKLHVSRATYAEMQYFNRHCFLLFQLDYLHDRNYVKRSDFDGKLLTNNCTNKTVFSSLNFNHFSRNKPHESLHVGDFHACDYLADSFLRCKWIENLSVDSQRFCFDETSGKERKASGTSDNGKSTHGKPENASKSKRKQQSIQLESNFVDLHRYRH